MLAGNHLAAPEPEHDEHGDAHEQPHAGEIDALQRDEALVAADVLGVGGAETLDLEGLLSIGADDAHAGQVFLRDRADLGELLLDRQETAVDGSAEVRRRRSTRTASGMSEMIVSRGVDRQHHRDGDDERECGGRRVHDRRADHLPHRPEVVGGARHQVAGAALVEERQLEPLQRGEEVVAKVVLDVARRADDDAAHQEAEHAADRGQRQQRDRIQPDLRRGDVRGQVVNRVFQNPWARQGDGGRGDHTRETEEEGTAIPGHVTQQPTDRRH